MTLAVSVPGNLAVYFHSKDVTLALDINIAVIIEKALLSRCTYKSNKIYYFLFLNAGRFVSTVSGKRRTRG